MRSAIVAICLLIPLVIIFVIIDRRDFYSGDDVAVQTETTTMKRMLPIVETAPKSTTATTVKPVEKSQPGIKPVETKSVAEMKPAEKESIEETKPPEGESTEMPVEGKSVETKLVAENKQKDWKPAETLPVISETETKLVIETPLDASENPVPSAVPSVTEEEAEKLNLEARERMEPFYKLYPNSSFSTVCVQGTVRATSVIPNPAKNDYDNCLYALFVEIDSILSDMTSDAKIPYELIVDVPIMKDKTIIQDNIFKPGDSIYCICAEYDAMPQAIQEIQLSDDIQSYEHLQFYSLVTRKIQVFLKGGKRDFAKREITVLPVQSLPKDEKASELRKKRIQNEIANIEEELKKHGGSFETWKEEYKSIAEKYKQLSSDGYKGWIKDSFFAAGGKETTYKTQEYIEGILPYKKYLEENNIDLIVVRVPSKWDFAARVLGADVFQENPAWIEHYYECLKNDIEIIDPMPEMWKHRFDYPLFYYYHLPKESHPFLGESIVSAELISDVLNRYSFEKSLQPISLSKSTFEISEKYMYPEGNKTYTPSDPVFYYSVVQDGKSIGGLVASSGSPFLFLSNSFFYHPARYSGGSVPGYSSFYLQCITDWYYQQGLDNAMIRNLVARPSLLANRKAVIMGEHPDHWKGTPGLPKYILDKAEIIRLEKVIESDNIISSLTDKDQCIIKKDDPQKTILEISKTSNKISFLLDIPFLETNKKTCMLRINYYNSTFSEITIKDSRTKTLIDSNKTSMESNVFSDLFIPLSEEEEKYVLEIKLSQSLYNTLSIKNIELWYY